MVNQVDEIKVRKEKIPKRPTKKLPTEPVSIDFLPTEPVHLLAQDFFLSMMKRI